MGGDHSEIPAAKVKQTIANGCTFTCSEYSLLVRASTVGGAAQGTSHPALFSEGRSPLGCLQITVDTQSPS